MQDILGTNLLSLQIKIKMNFSFTGYKKKIQGHYLRIQNVRRTSRKFQEQVGICTQNSMIQY